MFLCFSQFEIQNPVKKEFSEEPAMPRRRLHATAQSAGRRILRIRLLVVDGRHFASTFSSARFEEIDDYAFFAAASVKIRGRRPESVKFDPVCPVNVLGGVGCAKDLC